MKKPEKRPSPEDIFLKNVTTLIKNLLIDNVNYKNGYYSSNDIYKIINDTKERATYILNRIDEIKHLVYDELPTKG